MTKGRGRPRNEGRAELITCLYEYGYSAGQIADRLGIKKQTALYYLKTRGVERRSLQFKKEKQ